MAKQRNGPTISRIEQDRKAAVGKGGIEREDRLHVVLLKDILPDLELVLLPAAQRRLENRHGALPLPVEVDLRLQDLAL